jgi:hypothetical protein
MKVFVGIGAILARCTMAVSATPPRRSLKCPLLRLAAMPCLFAAVLFWALSLAAPAGARFGYTLTVTATPVSGAAGTKATITAVANMSLKPRLFINIRQVGGKIVKVCRDKKSCSVVVTPPGDENPSPAPVTTHTIYRAQISPDRHRIVPRPRAYATASASVSRTQPHCVASTCPTM